MLKTSLYAAIDLGSNSFHMIMVRKIFGCVQTLARIKRKVRLAVGLDENNYLSQQAMEHGWQCLQLFSEYLQDLPTEQVQIVAITTLRFTKNAAFFIKQGEYILGHPQSELLLEKKKRNSFIRVSHIPLAVQIND